MVVDNDPFTVPMPLRVGFGASGAWGKSWFAREKAIALVEKAYDSGVRYFDTAGFYNHGEAERRLGTALKGCNDVIISTKTGTKFNRIGNASKDFSPSAIRRDLEDSLRRLGRDKIDTLYLHGPEDWIVSHTRAIFEDLKSERLIMRSGVCGDGSVIESAIEERKTDAVMALYHLFDTRHGALFEKARAAGIHTAAIAVLGQALYRRGFWMPKNGPQVWALVRALVKNRDALRLQRSGSVKMLHHLDGYTAAQAMIGFVLSNPSIDVALSSTTSMTHLVDTLQMGRANGLDGTMLATLAALANKNCQDSGNA